MSISRRALAAGVGLVFALGSVPAATASDATANGDDFDVVHDQLTAPVPLAHPDELDHP